MPCRLKPSRPSGDRIFEPEELIDAGDDRVLVLFRVPTRGKGSSARTEAQPGWIYGVRGGRAVRIDSFLDRDDALAAAGLPASEDHA